MKRVPQVNGEVPVAVRRHLLKSLGFWVAVCIALALCLVPGIMFWNASVLERKIQRATALQAALSSRITGVTSLRVWGAGERQSRDGFCHCARVRRPERIYYETLLPTEIAEFASRIQVRPYLALDTEYATCSTITIDFLRGDDIAVSFHLMGKTIRSWGASIGSVPITMESSVSIEEWLKQRGIRDKLEKDLLQFGVGG